MDMLSFYLVEEAIKRNRGTIQMQEKLSLMIWERVRIELIYIKNLQEWSDTASKETLKQELDIPEFDRITIECILMEGQETAAVHQNVYNALMSDEGPYIILQNNTGLKRPIVISSVGRGLQDIQDEFIKYNKRRIFLLADKQKRKQSIESMKTAIQTLEDQLSSRSRLTVARRSGQRGHRKVDAMMNRLSLLRRHIELETSMLKETEKSLEYFVQEKNVALQGMMVELEELERQRMLQIHAQMKRFTEILGTLDDMSKRERRQERLSQIVVNIKNENIGQLIDEQWRAVERKAKARKAGQIYNLEDFLAPSVKNKRKKQQEHESSKSHATLNAAGEISSNNRMFAVRSVIDRVGDTTVVSYSSSGHTLISTFYTSSDESLGMNNPTKKPSESSGSSSGSRIETIFIPADKENINRLPPPFPTREFCPGPTDDEDSSSTTGSGSIDCPYAFDPHNVRLVPKSDQDFSSNVDVALMRNVKVIADHDYTARKRGEMSFRKGQIIKQKAGENEYGFSYGWLRENKLTAKQYGWYPSGLVSLYYQDIQA